MNVFLVHHRSPHHAQNSGYGRLVDYIDAEVVVGTTKFSYTIAKLLAGFHSQAAGIYNSSSILKSIELYKLLKKHKQEDNIVHFLNGERDIRHLGFFKRTFPNTKFCATFHKPPEVLRKTITDVSGLRNLDAAIAVGSNQVEFLKDWLQLEHVKYIPHGVDTQFFKPGASKRRKNTLLFVGQHLRDFETLNETIPQLTTAIDNLKFNVVVHPAYAGKIIPHKAVKILTDVNDEVLRNLYQEATALYLPMLNSTACNSILEALACGLPIITSNVGGNAGYLGNTSNMLIELKGNDTYITAIASILENDSLLSEMGKSSRQKALVLNWSKIAIELNNYYNSLH